MATDRKKIPENYRLVADIDFQGRVNINTNVAIARLEGTDNGHTIKNLTINKNEVSQFLIKKLTTSLKNVNFDHVTITNTRTSGNYNSIVRLSYADIDDVSFTNITIDAPKMAYSTPIGTSRGYHVSNITLDTINVKGANYTAGFIGYAEANGYNDITATNITAVGQSYTGGIMGYKVYDADTTYFNFNITNSNITGTTYVGGIFGYGSADNSSVADTMVAGTSYVGGVAGSGANYEIRNVTVTRGNISGSTSYIGGIFGTTTYYLYSAYLFNSRVEGTLATTNYVGGICGNSGGYSLRNSGVLDSTITSNGNYVGGIFGYQGDKSITYSFVYNTTVTGTNNVGGATGITKIGTVAYVNINAYVTATGSNAGGVHGYVANSFSTNASNPIRVYNAMVIGGSINAQTNAGGLVGLAEAPLYQGHFYSNIVATSITTPDEYGYWSAAIGNNKDYNALISNLLVYNNMRINEMPINQIQDNGLTSANYVTLTNLKTQATYTSKGFSTSRYDFTVLASNKFPLLKNSSGAALPNQVAIDLPTEEVLPAGMMLRPFEIHELPTYKVYPVDVDKINVEFSKVDSYTTFKVLVDNKVVASSTIDDRTYTFKYDFNTPFEMFITDEVNKISDTYNPEDFRKNISVYADRYYYLKDNVILSNGPSIGGNFINLYLNKAIDKDGNIYELPNKSLIGNVDGLIIEDNVTPLFSFEYDSYIIKTYYNYSQVINGDEVVEHEAQYLVKNGRLEIIDSSLPSIKDSIIIDSYGGNFYQTVLGNNGIIYNIRYPINTPNDFINKNIKDMTNNVLDNTGFILVSYEDGSIYGFDYRTGTKLFSSKAQVDISLIDYIKDQLFTPAAVIKENTFEEYEKTMELEEKLKETTLEEAIDSDNKSMIETTYVSKYDPIKGEFTIYDEEALLASNDSIVSTSDEILSDVRLIKFYSFEELNGSYGSVSGLGIFFSILVIIVISLIIYLGNMKKLKTAT